MIKVLNFFVLKGGVGLHTLSNCNTDRDYGASIPSFSESKICWIFFLKMKKYAPSSRDSMGVKNRNPKKVRPRPLLNVRT